MIEAYINNIIGLKFLTNSSRLTNYNEVVAFANDNFEARRSPPDTFGTNAQFCRVLENVVARPQRFVCNA